MKTCTIVTLAILCAALLVLPAGGAVGAETKTITGTINDDYQLVDDAGSVYEIADNEMGSQAIEYAGKKIEIEGVVEEEGGIKVITVTAFKPLEE